MRSQGFGAVGQRRKPRIELILHPQIPKPLHGVAPRVVMGEEWWSEVRSACYRASGRQCACCGMFFSQVVGYPRPEAHEVYDIDYVRGRATYVEAVALCHWCHMSIHIGMVENTFLQGQFTPEEYAYVHNHRQKYVKRALEEGHRYPDMEPGEKVPWADWRMIVEGKEHGPIYKSYGEWLAHYGGPTMLIEEEFFD